MCLKEFQRELNGVRDDMLEIHYTYVRKFQRLNKIALLLMTKKGEQYQEEIANDGLGETVQVRVKLTETSSNTHRTNCPLPIIWRKGQTQSAVINDQCSSQWIYQSQELLFNDNQCKHLITSIYLWS